MFPRDYFSRVGKVAGWFIVTILALLGVLAVIELFRAEVKEDTAFRDARLYLCDCVDNGNHGDPSYHQSTCGYVTWWNNWLSKYGNSKE